LGIDFIEDHFHIFEKDLNHTLSQSEVQKLQLRLEESRLALEIKKRTLQLQGAEGLVPLP
jgi:hypothetical protein